MSILLLNNTIFKTNHEPELVFKVLNLIAKIQMNLIKHILTLSVWESAHIYNFYTKYYKLYFWGLIRLSSSPIYKKKAGVT